MSGGISRPIDWSGADSAPVPLPAGGFLGLLDFIGYSIGTSNVYRDTGGAITNFIGSGIDVIDIGDAGGSLAVLVGSGSDDQTVEDIGGATAILVGSGEEYYSFDDIGGALAVLGAVGSDASDVDDNGGGVLVSLGSGEDTYLIPFVSGTGLATTYGGFMYSPPEAIPGLSTREAKGEEAPENLVVQGKKASRPEWTVAMAADRLKIRYQFQVPIEYGRQMKGGQVIDFIFYVAPTPVPCYVQGDYWHSGLSKRQEDQWMMKRVQAAFNYSVTAPVEIWEHEVPTVDAAVSVLRQRLHM